MAFTINLAKDFTPTPLGKTAADGSRSAEVFREDILRPALEKSLAAKEKLTVDFSGMVGVNPSFLEEAFGGLVRNPSPQDGKLLTAEAVLEVMDFYCDKEYFDLYIKKIINYIKDGNKGCEW